MNQAYVQTCSGVSLAELKAQLEQDSFHYFLRWPHTVSGIVADLPANFPSPEGQAFNQSTELRWQQRGDRYDLLWLSSELPADGFEKLPGDWIYEDHGAMLYSSTETRLPKVIRSPRNISLGQRYFRDRRTAIIHFVSLYCTKG